MNLAKLYVGLLSSLLLWTLVLNIYHAGVYPHPFVDLTESAQVEWIDRHDAGINHLVLQGPPFARGRAAGQVTAPLLLRQEQELVAKLSGWIPSHLLLQGLVLGAITWFQGADHYLDPIYTHEMFGVSLSAPHQFDFLADGFTRQVAYHGLHEVGQKMVDQGFEDMGCTVVAIPFENSFVIGRNFDFEGGRIFDSEKIAKWVFPDHGHAFVSVIWAGMVGAVTGVNDQGVYISINAAGSADSRRLGTPSTLVLLKVLQEATTAEEALKIIEQAQMFITDIFVVLDAKGHLYRVEKSPARMATIAIEKAGVITNHLVSPSFANDPTNRFRMQELTSVIRAERGTELLKALAPAKDAHHTALQVLSVLRDKGVDENGKTLNLGNRRAIDALIATHSVVFNPFEGIFYISQGPALTGAFLGFDLKASFTTRHPVQVDTLPPDPLVTASDFNALKETNQQIAKAHRLVRFKQCSQGAELLKQMTVAWTKQSPYYHALGDAQACLGDVQNAKQSWQEALRLTPAYAAEKRQLERSLQR